MQVEAIATIAGAAVTVLAFVAGATAWVRNVASALRREMEEKLQIAEKSAERQVTLAEDRVKAQIAADRHNADRVYASQTAVASMEGQLSQIREQIGDVRSTMHELVRELRGGRRRSHSPSSGTPRSD